jgi:hypothetical protein
MYVNEQEGSSGASPSQAEIGNAVLMGGIEVAVVYRSVERGSAAGLVERVLVRELAVKEYPRMLAALNDETVQVEVFCGRPRGWGETLTAKSHDEVMRAGEALNKEPFFGWCARRTESIRRMAPGKMEEMIASALKKAKEGAEVSPNGSPRSPLNAG